MTCHSGTATIADQDDLVLRFVSLSNHRSSLLEHPKIEAVETLGDRL